MRPAALPRRMGGKRPLPFFSAVVLSEATSPASSSLSNKGMGGSEWGVLCRSKAEARRVLQAAQEHNDCCKDVVLCQQVGEVLTCNCILRFHGLPFLCLSNLGGRTYTNKWLWERLSDIPIFWPFNKPPGWHECEDTMWEANDHPPGPPPAVRGLGDWLEPCKPETVGETLTCDGLLRFHGLPFLCLHNGGGRTLTSKWLWDRLSDVPIFWALSKPPGWRECE
ncbi:hypothetical protein C2E21_7769 [Chlorella sorokiniana]|uniref:Uncharacterized protein n=1 Tax=Chlorella sorokiniana TaxID=3076 RepID=A0A2P6TGB2_CHLSO|nr:hypothetical protein C2E21_7769 [Chlorella sorokiniana]|eukprot:PRW33153.1 hypothetical protein C2E21_7769 [Chlorella sorokiniana]